MAAIRYILQDVDAALAFYTDYLGFTLVEDPSGNPIELFEESA